jgi:hypothetical protein
VAFTSILVQVVLIQQLRVRKFLLLLCRETLKIHFFENNVLFAELCVSFLTILRHANSIFPAGGHWYDADDLDLDPWAIIGYDQTDSAGYGQFAPCVYTGFDVASNPDQLVGHAFVVHADDGSRVSCGVIGEADGDYEPTTFTADTIPIPGVEDSDTTMTGSVSVMTIFQDVTDGVCYIGMAMGLEPDVEIFCSEQEVRNVMPLMVAVPTFIRVLVAKTK